MKKRLLSFIFTFLFISQASALTLKIGVLAPDGSSWGKSLKAMSKEIKKATQGKVKIKMYLGGSLGDEPDVLRKIRVGQVHGGLFTGKTLGDIYSDARILEVPFSFQNDANKVDRMLSHFQKLFSVELQKKGFENLGFFKIGFVYFVSRKEIKGFGQLKDLKIWSWQGDPIVETMIKTMGLNSVPLPLPDVLSSLTTGIIDSAYAPPMGIIALQWSSKIKYLLDYPLAFSLGAFLIDSRKWNKISRNNQVLIKKIAKKYITQMNKQTAKENNDSIQILQSMGVKIIKFSKNDIAQGKVIRKKILQKLNGKFFSPRIVKEFNSLLK